MFCPALQDFRGRAITINGDSRLTGSVLVAVVGPVDLPAQTDASNFGGRLRIDAVGDEQ
jgi:hypothetical protein